MRRELSAHKTEPLAVGSFLSPALSPNMNLKNKLERTLMSRTPELLKSLRKPKSKINSPRHVRVKIVSEKWQHFLSHWLNYHHGWLRKPACSFVVVVGVFSVVESYYSTDVGIGSGADNLQSNVQNADKSRQRGRTRDVAAGSRPSLWSNARIPFEVTLDKIP